MAKILTDNWHLYPPTPPPQSNQSYMKSVTARKQQVLVEAGGDTGVQEPVINWMAI